MRKTNELPRAERLTTLSPLKEFRAYQRKLPHWEQPGSLYFVTFNTSDGFVLSDEAKDLVFGAVKFHSGKKYELHALVVMDTHVHLVAQPSEKSKDIFYSIAEIMHSIKSYTANRLQKFSGKKGSVWVYESYDRIIRDEKEYLEKMNYIINNPLKAGLVREPDEYKWLFYKGQGVD
ncbi:MAG: transposase [Chloroflexi bacterium]|nr:transposase [Chloroflexota bacterium]